MHIWWLPAGANISSYCHIPTLIASSLMSPLLWFSTIKFRTSWISYLSYFISYSLRAGLKLYLFCYIWKAVLCEQFPSPECQPWLNKLSYLGWSQPSCHWHVNPTNLKRWALAVLGGIFLKTPKQEPYVDAFLLSQLTTYYLLLLKYLTTYRCKTYSHTTGTHTRWLSLWTSLHKFKERTLFLPSGKVSQGCCSCFKKKITALWKQHLKHKTAHKVQQMHIEGEDPCWARCHWRQTYCCWSFQSYALSAISSRK